MTVPAPTADPTTPPAAEPPAGTPGTTETSTPPPGKAPTFSGEFDPERAAKAIEAARNDAAAEKAKRQRAEQESAERWKSVAQALGLGDDGKPDPAKLTEQLTSAQTAAKERSVELAVYKAAARLGANPDAVLDSRTFLAGVAGLDPSDAGFPSAVEAAIGTALNANPLLRAGTPAAPGQPPAAPPGPSGGEFNGSPASERQITEAELAQMDPEQIAAAYEAGKLKHLL